MAKAGALRCYWVTIVVVGACVLVVSGVLYWYYGKMVKDRTATLQKRNVLSRNSTALDAWQNSETPPIYRSFYVFNVSNAYEVRIRVTNRISSSRVPTNTESGQTRQNSSSSRTTRDCHIEPTEVTSSWRLRTVRSASTTTSPFSTYRPSLLSIPHFIYNDPCNTSMSFCAAGALQTLAMWARFSGWQHEKELANIFFELNVPLFVTLPVSDLLWGYEDPLWGSPRVRRFFERKLHIHLSNDTHFGMFYERFEMSWKDRDQLHLKLDEYKRYRDVFFILMIFGGVLVALGLLLAAVSLLSRRPTALTGRRGYETI